MANIVFEGDNDLSEKQLEYVKSVLEKKGYVNNRVKIETFGKKGDNFCSNLKRMTVLKENNEELFKMIVKVAPTNQMMRMSMNIGVLFRNEITMYTEVFPKYIELFESENVSQDQRINIPVCYGCLSEDGDEIILLEDLQLSDYVLLKRLTLLSNETVKMVLKCLAILHSLSYAYQRKYPESYLKAKENIQNYFNLMASMDHLQMFMLKIENDAKALVDNETYKKALTGTTSEIGNLFNELSKSALESNCSVIQHGDCWTNNILFKLKDEKPVEAIMIDYQQSRLASPASDIVYFTFNCTAHETRSKHFYEWLDYYYDELTHSLKNFGLQADTIYPREQLDADIKKHGKVALAAAIPMASNMCRQAEEIIDFKDNNLQVENVEEMVAAISNVSVEEATFKEIKRRIEGCIKSALELGMIEI